MASCQSLPPDNRCRQLVKSSSQPSAITVSFVSLGCAKNLVDSEKMLGLLAESGLFLVDSDTPADAVIINTCGFIEDARAEAIENIQTALADKQSGRVGRVIVTGCLSQLWADGVPADLSGIDAVVGLAHRDRIAEIVTETVLHQPVEKELSPRIIVQQPASAGSFISDDRARLRITERPWAYLRISEGCNRNCTFCTIPAIRGAFRSKPLETVIAEARELVADGAAELNLIGQETSSYGADLSGRADLSQLLRRLDQIDELRWIRVLYVHPATFTDEQIAAVSDCQKVVPYIDMPLQHASDRILKLMGRRITRRQTEQLITKLRRTIDNITIRTTMLVGFPSETAAEFEELLDFVKQWRFEVMAGFAYSAEPNTPAARLPGQLDEQTKQQRIEDLMLTQQTIAFEHAESLIGRTIPCLITDVAGTDPDEQPADGEPSFFARHAGQAPQVDSICMLIADNASAVTPGQIVSAQITARQDYDLTGRIKGWTR